MRNAARLAVVMAAAIAWGAALAAPAVSPSDGAGAQPDVSPLVGRPPLGVIELKRVRINGTVNLQNRQVNRYMNLEADVKLTENVDVVGVTYAATVSEILDENGENLLDAEQTQQQLLIQQQRSFRPTFQPNGGDRERTIRVGVNVGNLNRIPTTLKRVRGQTLLLVADKTATVDVAPVAPGRLVDLNGGLRVQITDAVVENNRLTVVFDFESSQPNPFFNPNVQPPFVSGLRVLTTKGEALVNQGLQPNVKSIDDGVARGEARVMFQMPEGQKAAALQFDVVTKVSEQVIEFDVRDIVLPGATPVNEPREKAPVPANGPKAEAPAVPRGPGGARFERRKGREAIPAPAVE